MSSWRGSCWLHQNHHVREDFQGEEPLIIHSSKSCNQVDKGHTEVGYSSQKQEVLQLWKLTMVKGAVSQEG